MIRVEGLCKYYGDFAALRDVSFTVQRGEVVGFLGLNGAGKSTTLRILGCVLQPTSGRVDIDGVDATADATELKKRIGFLPDTPPLYDEMSVRDYLRFAVALKGVPAANRARMVSQALDTVNLGDVADDVIATLSHGYRQRVGVAQALVHQPDFLILDEPTSGLDPVQIVEMRHLIQSFRGKHTVLVSSHILSEISQVCDRLLVIQNGELVAEGSEADLATRWGGGLWVEVDVMVGADVDGSAQTLRAALASIAEIAEVHLSRVESGTGTFQLRCTTDVRPKVVRALASTSLEVVRIDRAASRLEEIFLKLVHGDKS